MSDTDELDLEGGDSQLESSTKKRSGLMALLPRLLKFVAIGLGALIFIVTVAVITYNIMNRGGKNQTAIADPASPYRPERQEYTIFASIGSVRTRTKDTSSSYAVIVDMVIGYDLNDKKAQSELTSRQYELRDFVRSYFSGKYHMELLPENETRLKKEIVEYINQRILAKSKIRDVFFNQLDVTEM